MADTTLPGVLLKGAAASRPAASAVAKGTIYSATDTGAITQSDGSSWSTYATISGSGLTDPMTTRGDIIVRNSSNTTARLGRGSAGTVLSSDGTDVSWQTPAGGGGITQAYVGYNTVGASWETVGANSKAYSKQFTLANACLVTNIDAYLQGASANSIGAPLAAIYTDSAGSPAYPIIGQSGNILMSVPATTPAWIASAGISIWLPAGTYHAIVRLADTGGGILPQIAYDTGTDQTLVMTIGSWFVWTGATTTARKYSIRINTIR